MIIWRKTNYENDYMTCCRTGVFNCRGVVQVVHSAKYFKQPLYLKKDVTHCLIRVNPYAGFLGCAIIHFPLPYWTRIQKPVPCNHTASDRWPLVPFWACFLSRFVPHVVSGCRLFLFSPLLPPTSLLGLNISFHMFQTCNLNSYICVKKMLGDDVQC